MKSICPTVLMERSRDSDAAVIIDAVYSGAKPGTIYRLNAAEEQIPIIPLTRSASLKQLSLQESSINFHPD